MAELLVVRSKIKTVAKNFNVSSDFADALSAKMATCIKDACARTLDNNRRTVMKKDIPHFFTAPKKAKEMLVVRSKVKDHVKNCNVAGDFHEGLNAVATMCVNKACERAKANKRSTIQPRDL